MESDRSQLATLNDVVVPTQVLALLVEVAKEQGIDERCLLEGTGLRCRDLLQLGTFVNYDQSVAIWRNAYRLYPQPGLGLIVGSRETLASWGLLGFAMMSCPNLGSALEMAGKYYQTGTGFLDLEFNFSNVGCDIVAFAPKPIGALLPTLVEELFSCIIAVFPTLTGVPCRPLGVEVAYDRPEYGHLYSKIFYCPVSYGGERNVMHLDGDYVERPLVTADQATANLAEQLCRDSLFRQSDGTGIIGHTRRILLRTPGRFPSMELVAEALGLSVRSLRRRLKENESSYQELLDDVRMNLAIGYLRESNMPGEDVAALAGFSEYSNFRRAFRRWTGRSPAEYRKDRQKV